MSSDDGNVYMIRGSASGDGDDEDEWVSPEPAEAVIVDTVVEATDLDAEDLDDLGSYVDIGDLAAVVGDGADDRLAFAVEGHEVTVTSDGDVSVED